MNNGGRSAYVRQVDDLDLEMECRVAEEDERRDSRSFPIISAADMRTQHETLPPSEFHQLQENHATDRSSILDDQIGIGIGGAITTSGGGCGVKLNQLGSSSSGNDFNGSFMGVITQANLTTNQHNLSTSKIGLNGNNTIKTNVNKQRALLAQTRNTKTSSTVKSPPPSQPDSNPFEFDYPIDSKDMPPPTFDAAAGAMGDHSQQVIVADNHNEFDNHYSNCNGASGSSSSKVKKISAIQQQQQHLLRGSTRSNDSKPKRKPINLQIEIPDSDEEKKARTEAYKKKQTLIAQQQLIQQQQLSTIPPITAATHLNIQSPCSSSRVNDIIKQRQQEVENLETIQIDYDSETIEGLSDDQCLELYCEGSVKLKNSQRLQCTLAYEQHLVTKIRNTTRLVYSNIRIVGSGNLSSRDFISEHIVAPLKRENQRFKSSDISEAFTVQCADYVHFNIRKNFNSSMKLFLLLMLLQMTLLLVKIQDAVFDSLPILKFTSILVAVFFCLATYSYMTGVYVCNNDSIRRGLFLSRLFFVLQIIQFIVECFVLDLLQVLVKAANYKSQTIEVSTANSAHSQQTTANGTAAAAAATNPSEYYKTVVFYLIVFLISIIIPSIITHLNQKTTAAVRKIVNIVSNEAVR